MSLFPAADHKSDSWKNPQTMSPEPFSCEEVPSGPPGVTLTPERGRRWFRFEIKHLLWLTACVAIAITALKILAGTVGYANTTVEIIRYHPTGTVEFLVLLPDGFAHSGVSVPVNTPSVDYSKLIGTTYKLRYRARRVLWLPPQKPVIEAYYRIQSEVDRFANEEQAN
jgi:hypothetical protein